MNWSQKYKQLVKDINYITTTYDEVYDYCGAWCNTDKFKELLNKPTYETAFNIQLSLLNRLFQQGYEQGYARHAKLPVQEDNRLKRIAERWKVAISESQLSDE